MGRTPKADWPLEKRLLAKRAIDPDTGCWNYIGAPSVKRYPQMNVRAFPEFGVDLIGVHRLAYLLWVGPIPDGFDVHHRPEICNSKRCFNPAHIEAVDVWTHRVMLEPGHPAYVNARKTHCHRGHLFTGKRVRRRTGKRRDERVCTECQRENGERRAS